MRVLSDWLYVFCLFDASLSASLSLWPIVSLPVFGVWDMFIFICSADCCGDTKTTHRKKNNKHQNMQTKHMQPRLTRRRNQHRHTPTNTVTARPMRSTTNTQTMPYEQPQTQAIHIEASRQPNICTIPRGFLGLCLREIRSLSLFIALCILCYSVCLLSCVIAYISVCVCLCRLFSLHISVCIAVYLFSRLHLSVYLP